MRYLKMLVPMTLLVAGCSKGTPDSLTKAAATETAAPEAKAEKADPHASLPNYEVDRVDQLVSEKKAVPVDANGEDTRKEYGVLPNAVLLSSATEFAPSELPADKSTELVFYCGGQRCTAAPKAAQRAQSLGYANVHVMRDGIRGWVKAGKQVVNPTS